MNLQRDKIFIIYAFKIKLDKTFLVTPSTSSKSKYCRNSTNIGRLKFISRLKVTTLDSRCRAKGELESKVEKFLRYCSIK